MVEHNSGSLFIVAAPSGGGKTSLVKALIQELSPSIAVSVSHTTRAMRPGETQGIDYFFVDEPTFFHMIDDGDFVEHARVFEHLYGTSRMQIKDRLQEGIDVVLDIDWQGAQQIKQAFPEAVSVFILPPSLDVLKQRLLSRQQDASHVISMRMQRARDELSHYHEFDYLIVNDDFASAALELKAIVVAHRLRMNRQSFKQRELLSFLLASQ